MSENSLGNDHYKIHVISNAHTYSLWQFWKSMLVKIKKPEENVDKIKRDTQESLSSTKKVSAIF